MVTIKDISKESGYSVTTVSRALNDFDDVNEVTKEHIRKVAEKLNYVPNMHAKRLVTQRSNRIGFIIFEFGRAAGEDNFVYEMMVGMQKKCATTGHELLFLFGSVYADNNESIEKLILKYDLSGLIIMGCNMESNTYKELKQISRPVVCIDGDIETKYVGAVSIDNYQASYEAVTYLKDTKQRKRILMLNGKKDSFACRERLRGYQNAMGDSFAKSDVFYAEYSDIISYDIVKKLMQEEFKYDGIFASSDMMAVGAIHALQEYKIEVGKKVDVIGFDNIPLSAFLQRPLTTINQDKTMLGDKAVTMLLDIIEQKSENRKIIVPHQIVYRATT